MPSSACSGLRSRPTDPALQPGLRSSAAWPPRRQPAWPPSRAPAAPCGQHLARLGKLALGLPPKLAQAAFLRLGAAMRAYPPPPRRRARSRRRWRWLAASMSSTPSRLRSARRLGSGAGALRGGDKPSQRHRSPSRETSRCPALSWRYSRAPSACATMPIWRSRRVSCGGAVTWAINGSTPAGRLGSRSAGGFRRQCRAPRPSPDASRSSPSAAASAIS